MTLGLLGGIAPATSATLSNDASPTTGSVKVRECTFDKPLTKREARVLVGLKQRDARVLAINTYGWTWRVGARDGEQFVVTTDYLPCRVTVAIKKGRVTKVLGVG
jgi:hypothetical protein